MPKYIVRYGSMRALGVLNTRGGEKFARGARVVARTNRGLEAGEVLTEATEQAVAQLKDPASGQILRRMTAEDENELAHIESKLSEEFETCQSYVERLKLQMDLVDVEHVFGGERIVVYYLAEQRVDFRELVKQLASEFQTRIEMRQIGVRDEAKLLADYGDCGKPVCCNTHLSAMPPVSMKMAKLQKATLDPTKISGRCGRLKCCLRYEYDTYDELHKELPPIGSEIVTEQGRARVLSQEILSQQLLVQSEDNRRMVIDGNEVLTVLKRGSGKRGKPRTKNEKGEKSEGGADVGKGPSRGDKRTSDRRSSDKRTGGKSDGPPKTPARSNRAAKDSKKPGRNQADAGLPADAPQADAPPVDPAADIPPVDTPPVDTPVVDAPQADAPQTDTPVADAPPVDSAVADEVTSVTPSSAAENQTDTPESSSQSGESDKPPESGPRKKSGRGRRSRSRRQKKKPDS